MLMCLVEDACWHAANVMCVYLVHLAPIGAPAVMA